MKQDLINQLRESNEQIKLGHDFITFIPTYDCNFDAYPNVRYSAITNGYYLEEYFDLFRTLQISHIQVTLDGLKETHNQKRVFKNGKPTFDKIMTGVELYLNAGIPIKVRMNVDETNYLSCIELRKSLKDKWSSHESMLFFELFPIFNSSTNVIDELYQSELKIADDSGTDISELNRYLDNSLPIINHIITGKGFRPLYTFCNAHQSRKFFDPDGLIYSCILSVGQKEKAIGQYFPEFEMFEDSLFERNITTIEKCSKCKYAFLCGGGCALNLESGNIMESNCSYAMYVIHNVLPDVYENRKKHLMAGR